MSRFIALAVVVLAAVACGARSAPAPVEGPARAPAVELDAGTEAAR